MSQQGHNRPPVVLELTPEQAEFLLRNATVNIRMTLASLDMMKSARRETTEKMVELIEQFKEIKVLLELQGVTWDG